MKATIITFIREKTNMKIEKLKIEKWQRNKALLSLRYGSTKKLLDLRSLQIVLSVEL